MTLRWFCANIAVKPNLKPCHDVYLGWDSSDYIDVLANGPKFTIIVLFGPFLLFRQGLHNPYVYYPIYITPVIYRGVLVWPITEVSMSFIHLKWSELEQNN